jgi:hypothetical protein
MAVFWVVAPCSLVEIYQRFRGPSCLHHQGDLRTNRRENLKSYLLNSCATENPLSSIFLLLVASLFGCVEDSGITFSAETNKYGCNTRTTSLPNNNLYTEARELSPFILEYFILSFRTLQNTINYLELHDEMAWTRSTHG